MHMPPVTSLARPNTWPAEYILLWMGGHPKTDKDKTGSRMQTKAPALPSDPMHKPIALGQPRRVSLQYGETASLPIS